MNIKLNILYVFIVCACFTHAQTTIKFSKTYDFNDPNASTSSYLSLNTFKLNNDYLLCGVLTTSAINQGLGIVRTDSVGEIKYQKKMASPNNLGFTNNTATQAFIQLKNKNLLYIGQYELGLDYTSACMARINHNTGDTLWTKEYKQPGDTTYLLCGTELLDSSIISFGFRYYEVGTTLYSKPFMMKIDKYGNYKWHKYINSIWNNNNMLYLYQKIIKLNDNDFIVLGIKQSSVQNGFLMRIDTNATKQYEVNTPVAGYNTAFNDFIQLQDGSYLACGVTITGGNKYRKLLYQFNGATGAKIQHKIYNVPANSNGLLSLAQKPNGIIIAGGGTGYITPVNTYNSQGDILKLTSSLDSITTIYLGATNPADQMAPTQLILTPDDGFAACIASYPAASPQKFWLIKADSNACFTATCSSVGIKELEKLNDKFKIYPNPANDILNIELATLSGVEANCKIEIINAFGQTVYQSIINGQHFVINIKPLPNGIYTIQVKNEKHGIMNNKIVIEH